MMTANMKATLATICVGLFFVLAAIKPDIATALMLLLLLGAILVLVWLMFRDAFDD